MTDRYIICGRSPTSGKRMYYTTTGTLATRGRSEKFPSVEKAWAKARRLLSQYPQLRAYNLFAEKLAAVKRTNPGRAARREKAASAFEAFTGYAATHETTFKQKPIRAGFALGKLVSVTYEQNRVGHGLSHYQHDFKKNSRPLLVSSHDGAALAIVGGQFEITERGIEDR